MPDNTEQTGIPIQSNCVCRSVAADPNGIECFLNFNIIARKKMQENKKKSTINDEILARIKLIEFNIQWLDDCLKGVEAPAGLELQKSLQALWAESDKKAPDSLRQFFLLALEKIIKAFDQHKILKTDPSKYHEGSYTRLSDAVCSVLDVSILSKTF